MANTRKRSVKIPAPERAYDSQYYDKNCPFTGGLVVKKELLTGKVVKRVSNQSATIEWFKRIRPRSMSVMNCEDQDTHP